MFNSWLQNSHEYSDLPVRHNEDQINRQVALAGCSTPAVHKNYHYANS